MVQEIGLAAGNVWRYLESNGACTIAQIKKTLGLKETVLFMAVGWLAREGKISFEVEGKTPRISRSPQEVAQ